MHERIGVDALKRRAREKRTMLGNTKEGGTLDEKEWAEALATGKEGVRNCSSEAWRHFLLS